MPCHVPRSFVMWHLTKHPRQMDREGRPLFVGASEAAARREDVRRRQTGKTKVGGDDLLIVVVVCWLWFVYVYVMYMCVCCWFTETRTYACICRTYTHSTPPPL